MPIPTITDIEYFERLASTSDTVQTFASVAAPTTVLPVISIPSVPKGIYEVSFSIRILTGANQTVSPDNYVFRVGSTIKYRMMHNIQAASTSQIVGSIPFSTRVRVPEASTLAIFPVVNEVAASTVSGQIIYRKVSDYIA